MVIREARSILVLDDEADTVRTFESVLKSGGYEVVSFTSARKAFDYLAQHPTKFDLVISDIKMPLMNGIEFVKKVKEQLPNLRIVLVTAFDVDRAQSESIKSVGVSELVRKPLSMPQLLGIAAKHVRSNDEILDRIYCCMQCKAGFLFPTDVQDHKDMFGHLEFGEVPLA